MDVTASVSGNTRLKGSESERAERAEQALRESLYTAGTDFGMPHLLKHVDTLHESLAASRKRCELLYNYIIHHADTFHHGPVADGMRIDAHIIAREDV